MVCLLVFFCAAELFDWLQARWLHLSLPAYGVIGLLLAVVSNADHWKLSELGRQADQSNSSEQGRSSVTAAPPASTMSPSQTEPDSPSLSFPDKISFTIRRSIRKAN